MASGSLPAQNNAHVSQREVDQDSATSSLPATMRPLKPTVYDRWDRDPRYGLPQQPLQGSYTCTTRKMLCVWKITCKKCTTRAATLNCAPKANTSQPNVPTNWSDSIKPISAQKTSVSALGLSCFVCKHNIFHIFNQKIVRLSALGFGPTLHCVCTMIRVCASDQKLNGMISSAST